MEIVGLEVIIDAIVEVKRDTYVETVDPDVVAVAVELHAEDVNSAEVLTIGVDAIVVKTVLVTVVVTGGLPVQIAEAGILGQLQVP
jgi:hypothetical protein